MARVEFNWDASIYTKTASNTDANFNNCCYTKEHEITEGDLIVCLARYIEFKEDYDYIVICPEETRQLVKHLREINQNNQEPIEETTLKYIGIPKEHYKGEPCIVCGKNLGNNKCIRMGSQLYIEAHLNCTDKLANTLEKILKGDENGSITKHKL